MTRGEDNIGGAKRLSLCQRGLFPKQHLSEFDRAEEKEFENILFILSAPD
jgi:hypothetical protein